MQFPDLASRLKRRLTIRPYFSSDYDHAYRIIRAIGEEVLGRNLRLWDEVFICPTSYVWSAVVDGTPVGFAGMGCYEAGTMTFHTDLVDPDFQRQGIGSALLMARLAMLDADEIANVVLLATDRSKPFYERFGFQAEAEPNYDPMADYTIHSMLRTIDADTSAEVEAIISSATVDLRLDEQDPNPPSP